jgi:hypothetical protein
MAAKKIQDTPTETVTVSMRDEQNDVGYIRVGTNDVIENGKRVLKRYKIQTGKPVTLPVTVIEQLRNKYEMRLEKDGDGVRSVKRPLYYIEKA